MDQELLEKIPEITDLILPWIGMLISIVLFLWFKDFATQLAKGLAFKHDPHFQEGDLVWLEDEPATIIKIGATQTIFGIVNGRGMIWRFIPNGEIHNVKLEKIVSDKIHYDSEDEEARKLKKLLEDYDQKQDVKIEENKVKDVEQDTKILELLDKVEQEGLDIRKLIENLRGSKEE
tara:strand:- start:1124 stop:1651 length:528 start_codon:yes stop_codon:yes gene_type:complete